VIYKDDFMIPYDIVMAGAKRKVDLQSVLGPSRMGADRQGGFPCSKGVVEEEEKVVTVSKKGKAPKLTDEGHPIDSSCLVS
jgi:hypothetical protein